MYPVGFVMDGTVVGVYTYWSILLFVTSYFSLFCFFTLSSLWLIPSCTCACMDESGWSHLALALCSHKYPLWNKHLLTFDVIGTISNKAVVFGTVEERFKSTIGFSEGLCAPWIQRSSEDLLWPGLWHTYFKNLLGNQSNALEEDEDTPTILTCINVDYMPFTMLERNKVKSSLKQGKSAGPDGIPPEVFKKCDLVDLLHNICNRALTNGEIPSQ